MKKFIVLLIIFTIALSSIIGVTAVAEDTYYVVGSSEVKFYLEVQYIGLSEGFSIPKGYAFVCLERNINVGKEERYVKINYAGIQGLISESALATCTTSSAPEHISPNLVVALSAPATVHTYPTASSPQSFSGVAKFVGEYKVNGVTQCYAVVDANGDAKTIYYAYAKDISNLQDVKDLLNPPEINPNDNISDVEQGGPVSDSSTKTPENKTVLRIILVLGIVIPAFIIILIVFKPGRKKQKIEREVEEDSDRFEDY